jgi:hypothetical protein
MRDQRVARPTLSMNTVRESSALATRAPYMPKRFRKYLWRILDQIMPDGPPVFLWWVIVILLVVTGIVALSHW